MATPTASMLHGEMVMQTERGQWATGVHRVCFMMDLQLARGSRVAGKVT